MANKIQSLTLERVVTQRTELEAGIALARQKGVSAVDLLVDERRYSEEALAEGFCQWLKLPRVKVASLILDPEAAKAISEKIALKHQCLPLKIDGTTAYRDAVWLEAKKYDLKVGHKPSPLVRAEFDRWRETNDIRPLTEKVGHQTEPNRTNPQQPPAPDANGVEKRDLGREFLSKSAEQRLADPALRNAELSARAARDLASQRFGANDPKLKIAFASVDKMVSDQLRHGHQFSTPKVVQQIRVAKPDNKQQFDRPRI